MMNYLNAGAESDFSPIDLAASLAVNAVTTNLACKDASFRVGVMKDKNGDVPAWADARLIGGFAGAIVAQFFADNNPTLRRMGHDAAVGLLGSYVATETCRASAEAKMKDGASAGSENYLLGADEDLFDDDVLGLDAEMAELDEMNFVYGW